MAVQWPSELQEKLNQASFGLNIGETTIRSSVEVGPAKVRRRFTKGVDQLSCSIDLEREDYETFRLFFDTSLDGGTKTFDYIDPFSLTSETEEYRFIEPPKITIIGGNWFRVAMTWEKLP